MTQTEPSALDQRVQALRDRFQAQDARLQREINERRRPGRATDVSLLLVPPLRGEAAPDPLTSDEEDSLHRLEHKTLVLGIVVSMAISIPLWGVLGLVAWAILR